MPLAIAGGIIVVLVFVLWIAFGKEPGPGPADVAIAYETAWDRLDFDLLFSLSGAELRDGLRREQFIRVKRAAYADERTRGRIGARVEVEDLVATDQTAIVSTRITSDEGSVHNRVVLEKHATGWMVVGYSIRTS
jgi:hypothetical protein